MYKWMLMHILHVFLFISNAYSAEYFVSKIGDDEFVGSKLLPWQTINESINKLSPGDILNIADGIYTENIEPTVSGEVQKPILIRATNPFKVIVDGNGKNRALYITKVSYLSFEGMKFQNSGDKAVLQVSSSDGQPAEGNTETHHIILRKISVKGSCLDKNCSGLLIARSNDVLLEDSWVYGAGRYTLSVYGDRKVTIRRVVVRWDQWDGHKYKKNDPRNAIGIYNSHNNLIENVIILDAGKKPSGAGGDKGALLIAGGANRDTSAFINSSNNRFYGLIIHNNTGLAISLSSRVKAHDGNYFENGVIYGNSKRAITINKLVKNTTFNHMTLANHPDEAYANWSKESENTVLTNSLIMNNEKKAFIGDLDESYNIVYRNRPNYSKNESLGKETIVADPKISSIFNNNSKILKKRVGSDDKPRGANLMKQYHNGVETKTNLWPWLYEDEIYKDFCAPMSLIQLDRIGSNTSSWCDSKLSLTNYLHR
ncbi:MAG: hypothetical protein DIZ80_06425 [endosymbiont of Galathealinum brachiosum]|uniref:Right handed beta helix domain-containing protein n=1 Tax=endosymbiont of Galathealinum brachiosum TaxID=2200906 RepID=A0A370DFS7_9GAMM|nr:MAG: hypothetical protein DIZ80_06425 [endosymbiont of Galathealinum brachiosum]